MVTTADVGLLLGGRAVPTWFARAVTRVEHKELGSVSGVFLTEDEDSGQPDKDLQFYVDDIREKGLWTPVAAGQAVLRSRLGTIPELAPTPITEALAGEDVPIETFRLERPSEYRCAVPDRIAAQLKSYDVVFHWGVGILTGDVLNAPTYGVWGVHQGDIRSYRGGPPGFWEYVHDQSTAGVTVQQYTEELDGGRIVAERSVDIGAAPTWRHVRRRLCRASVPLFASGLDATDGDTVATTEPENLGTVYRPGDRTLSTVLRYLWRTIPGWLRVLGDGVRSE